MTKEDLVAVIASEADISKKAAEKAIKSFTATVVETVAKGEKVQLVGFGTFQSAKRAARNGKNPLTGNDLKIPAKTVPTFRAGKAFKDTVAKKK